MDSSEARCALRSNCAGTESPSEKRWYRGGARTAEPLVEGARVLVFSALSIMAAISGAGFERAARQLAVAWREDDGGAAAPRIGDGHGAAAEGLWAWRQPERPQGFNRWWLRVSARKRDVCVLGRSVILQYDDVGDFVRPPSADTH